MSIAFHTKRLRVYQFKVAPVEPDLCYLLFVGFQVEEDRPILTVNAVINTRLKFNGGYWVEWLETSTAFRRHGFAAELIRGIRKHLGHKLGLYGATPEGEAFCEAAAKPLARRGSGGSRRRSGMQASGARVSGQCNPSGIRSHAGRSGNPRPVSRSRRSPGR